MNTTNPARLREMKDPKSLIPYPGNAKLYSDLNETTDLEISMKLYGILNPIIIKAPNLIIAGNRRVRASIAIGLTEVPVEILADWEDETNINLHANISRHKTTRSKVAEALMFKEYGQKLSKEKKTFEMRRLFPEAKDKKIGWDANKFASRLSKIGETNLQKLFFIHEVDENLLDDIDEKNLSIDRVWKNARKVASGALQQLPTHAQEKYFCKACGNTYHKKISIDDSLFNEDEKPFQPKVKRTDTNDYKHDTPDMEEFFNTEENKKSADLINALYSDEEPGQVDVITENEEQQALKKEVGGCVWTASLNDELDPYRDLGSQDFEPPQCLLPVLYVPPSNGTEEPVLNVPIAAADDLNDTYTTATEAKLNQLNIITPKQ